MNSHSLSTYGRLVTTLPVALTYLALSLTVIAAVGWIFDLSILQSLINGLPTMKILTAVMIAGMAVSILINRSDNGNGFRILIIFISTSIVLVSAGQFLFKQYLTKSGSVFWELPSDSTSLSILLIGIMLLMLQYRKIFPRTIAIIDIITMLLPMHRMITFMVGSHTLKSTGFFESMSLPTSISLFLLCVSIILHPRLPYARQLSSRGLQGQLLRTTLPWVIVAPTVLVVLIVASTSYDKLDAEIVMISVVSVLTVTTTAIIWELTNRINYAETDRQLAISTLQDSEARANQIIENSPDAMLVIDEIGRIERVNARLEKMFGYNRDEILGKTVDILIPGRYRNSHKNSISKYLLLPKARFMGEGRDLFALRKDGTEVAVEIGLAPLDTPHGIFVLANIVDISGRLRTQAEIESTLHEKTLLLNEIHQIIERSPDAMLVVNHDGTIERINERMEQLFGYSRTELLGESVEILLPERFRAGHGASIASYLTSPKARFMGEGRDLYARCKDGSEVAVEIGLAPLESPNGIRVLANIVDISGRLRYQETIRAALKEKTLLLNEIHHRVKNNLQIVASLLNLQSGRVNNSDFSALIAESEGRVRAMALMHQILYERKDFALVDLDIYLRRLAELLGQIHDINRRGISIHIECHQINMDLVRAIPLGLVVNELLSNVFKHAFNGKNGEVWMKLRKINEHEATLVVKDNGVGLPDGFAFDSPDTLGMQIVQLLSEQIGATITASSNDGACIEMCFMPYMHEVQDESVHE